MTDDMREVNCTNQTPKFRKDSKFTCRVPTSKSLKYRSTRLMTILNVQACTQKPDDYDPEVLSHQRIALEYP